jgi:hypothetical protein
LTDPDSNILKSAADYLLEVARTTKGGRYRKSAKIEALRECKDEILAAHRSGISIHRIAQIFRERNVDISTQHLMRAIRLFIAEEERGGGKASAKEGRQGPAVPGEEKKRSVTYQPLEPVSPVVREEEFAKQLRPARYLAASSLPAARKLEPVVKTKTPRRERPVTKAGSKAKPEPMKEKAGDAELAKERRRAGRVGQQKGSSSSPHGSEKQRGSPERREPK